MDRSMSHFEAEIASAMAVVGHFLGLLPAFATIFAIAWYALNIWESKTVQVWLASRRAVPPTTPKV